MPQLYIPVISLEKAYKLSSLFYQLTTPNLDQFTNTYSTPLVHPSTREIRLPVDSENFFIHPNADKHLLDNFLQFFLDMGVIVQTDVLFVQNLIETERGNSVNLQLCLPEIWRLQLVDLEYLETNGWFDVESQPLDIPP